MLVFGFRARSSEARVPGFKFYGGGSGFVDLLLRRRGPVYIETVETLTD